MKLNKIVACLLVVCLITMNFSGVINIASVMATEITSQKELSFSVQEKTLSLGKSLRYSPLKKKISSKAEMVWSSSNPEVAVVDEKGRVTSVSRGTTTITVSVDGLTASYNLTVIPGKVSIYYEEDNAQVKGTIVMSKDEEKTFQLQDEAQSIVDSEVEWKSSKENICTVDEYGKVKTLENGSAVITASLKDNPKVKATLRISVATPVEEIIVDEENVLTYVQEDVTIGYTVLPESAANSRVKFEIEDKDIATVNTKGVVKGKSDGNTVVKIISVSNPEISTEVNVEVRAEREYKEVKTSEISSYTTQTIVQNDGSYKVDKDGIISILNDYGSTAKFTNNNKDIIEISNDENTITVKGLKDGAATITVDYAGMQDIIKITSGNYIDKTVLNNTVESDAGSNYDKEKSIQKIKAIQDPDDPEKEKDYVKDYPLEVGVGYEFTLNISPVTASIDDLNLELSNTEDFIIENGTVTALKPNKTTDLIASSKSNPKVETKIKLKSSIGNVKAISFAKEYVGENKLDINKYKSYEFNPIFFMESGKIYDPVADPTIVEDDVYKALKKNVKISCEDEDVVDVSGNKIKLKKGVNGTGILKMEYDKTKNSRGTEESEDIVAQTNFEAVGKVIETIKKISFVQKEYEVAPGETISFNPIFTLSEGTKLDPTEEGVVESEEYQQFLEQVGLVNGKISGDFVDATSLLNYTYLSNGNTNNVITTVYEGKCKIKMVVHADNNISAETTIEIKSPYVLQNQEAGLKVSKEIKETRYVNTDSLKIASDAEGNSEFTTIPRSTAVWTFEKYTNGYARIAYNGNENLYVEAKYLADTKEKTIKKEKKTTTSSSSSNSNSSNSSSSSSSSSSGSGSSGSSSGYNPVKTIKANRYVTGNSVNLRSSPGGSVITTLNKGTKVYAESKDANGWTKISIDSTNTNGYMSDKYLSEKSPNTGTKMTARDILEKKKDNSSSKNTEYRYISNSYVSIHKSILANSGGSKPVEKGTKVELVSIGNPNNNYAQIKYNGEIYYVLRRNLSINKP